MRFATKNSRVTVDVNGIAVTARILAANEAREIRDSLADESGGIPPTVLITELFARQVVEIQGATDFDGNEIEMSVESLREIAQHNMQFAEAVVVALTEKVAEIRGAEEKNSSPGVSGTSRQGE